MSLAISITTSGPLFDKISHDEVIKGTNEAINLIALQGEALVKAQLYPGHGKRTGYLQGSIHGGLISDLHAQVDAGLHTQGANVVYANWIEGISPRNNRSRFKGYQMFEKAMAKLAALDIQGIVLKHVIGRLT